MFQEDEVNEEDSEEVYRIFNLLQTVNYCKTLYAYNYMFKSY